MHFMKEKSSSESISVGVDVFFPSENYTTENFVNTVLEVTTQLGLEIFSIAGNSMGGHTAWRYALQYPDQIETLILIAAAGVRTEEDLERASSDGPLIWIIMSSDLAKGVLLYFSPRFFSEQGLKTAVADPDLVTENLVDQFHQLALMQGSRKAFISMFSGKMNGRGFNGQFRTPDDLSKPECRNAQI